MRAGEKLSSHPGYGLLPGDPVALRQRPGHPSHPARGRLAAREYKWSPEYRLTLLRRQSGFPLVLTSGFWEAGDVRRRLLGRQRTAVPPPA